MPEARCKTGRRRWAIVGLCAGLAGPALLFGAAEVLRAQAPDEKSPQQSAEFSAAAYEYVGVQQSIARINLVTGKIEVLSKRGDPRASLLVEDSRPWAWREVTVRPRRESAPQERGPQVPKPAVGGEAKTQPEFE